MPTISSITRRISFRSLIRTRYDNLHAPSLADLYVDGFRSMTVGRKLWALIIIKLILLFGGDELFSSQTYSMSATTTTPTRRPP